MVESNAIRELVGALSPDDKKKKSDTYSAVVSHIDEEGTVWVILAGSDKETPTASTSTEVKRGDAVTVSWRDNKLYIGGNYSNPSAGVGTVMPSVDFVTELIDKEITVNSINAATGYIKDLTAEHITADDIQASSGYIKELRADGITAEDITADHATIGDLDVNYAQIDAANVTDLSAQNAWVNKIMVQTGLLAHEGTVFTLDAIQVNAANITAGTLDVNRLIVTVDGQKYLVNIDPSTGTPSYEKMDGNIVEPRTITADKIVAHDITVQEITTENLVGTNGWINLNQGKFFYGNGASYAASTNAIDWNGTTLKIKGDIGDSVIFNSYSTTAEMNTAIGDAVDGIEVGGRNLLSDTKVFGAKDTTSIYLQDTGGTSLTSNEYNGTVIRNYPSYTLSSGTQNIVQYYLSDAKANEIFKHGQSYCLSFWAKGSGKFRTYLYSSAAGSDPNYCRIAKFVASDGDTGTTADGAKTWTLTNEWTRYWIVYTFDTTGHFDNRRLLFRHDYMSASPTLAGDFCGIKFEVGNKATEWSPAPEDVQNDIDAKKSIHTLTADNSNGAPYASILNWTAEGAVGDWGINTTATPLTNVKVGDTVRIAYKANDMGANGTLVYCIGTVTAFNNATNIKVTMHGLDTTVIDGGHILTGTLDATKVNVTNLNASNISSGTVNTARLDASTIKSSIVQTTDLNADKITSGSIAADRIKANVISAVNNGNGTINADKINVSQINIGSLSGTIGGRNLLRNTVVSNLNREKCNFPSANVSTTMADGIICYKFTGNNTVHGFNYTDDWGCLSSPLKANTTYTYSFWAKYSKAANFNFTSYGHFQINNSASTASDKTHEDVADKRVYSPSSVSANVWTRMSLTFTTNNLNGSSFGIYPLYNNGADTIMYAYGFKLEEGSKATDWTPAPEDSFGENIVRNVDATTVYSITMSSTESGFKNPFSVAVPRVSGENVYTVSFDAKSTTAMPTYCFWYSPNTTTFGKSSTRQTTTGGDGSIGISLTTAWQRYSITWVQSDTDATNKNLILCRTFVPSSGSVTVSVRAVKMEVGAIANPWSDANNYITQADNNGIRVHPSSTQNNSVVINADGLEVFKGGTGSANSVAFYGDTARIGKSSTQRVEVKSDGVYIYNPSNVQTGYYGSFARLGGYSDKNIRIDSNGIKFNSSADNVISSFGETIQVGKTGQKNIQITSTDLNVYDDDGSIPFQVSTASSSTTEPYSIIWYISANSSYTTQAYFKGAIVNNTVSVGVAASGIPTASDAVTLTNAGTPYTITVSGVKYTFTRYNGIVTYSIQNTNSAKRSCLVSFTQSYRKTTVKENSHIFDTRYQTVSIEDATGTCNDVTLYTYAGVAQLHLRVYHGSSSVSNGGLIYKGVLGGFAPIYDCYMVGQINGIYAVSGYIDSRGNIYIYNTSGGSRTVNSSNMARLSATYLLAQ